MAVDRWNDRNPPNSSMVTNGKTDAEALKDTRNPRKLKQDLVWDGNFKKCWLLPL